MQSPSKSASVGRHAHTPQSCCFGIVFQLSQNQPFASRANQFYEQSSVADYDRQSGRLRFRPQAWRVLLNRAALRAQFERTRNSTNLSVIPLASIFGHSFASSSGALLLKVCLAFPSSSPLKSRGGAQQRRPTRRVKEFLFNLGNFIRNTRSHKRPAADLFGLSPCRRFARRKGKPNERPGRKN